MKKQTLNEQISRIKNIMGVNESIDKSEAQGPSDQAKEVATKVLSDVMNREVGKYGVFDDDSFNNGEVMISFGHEDGESVTYYLDTDVSSHSSYTPGRSHMSNGDPGYPDEYTDAEYDLNVQMIEIDNGSGVIYQGKDFTDIMNVELSNGSTVGEQIYERFAERIGEWESEYDGEPDYDDYRDDD